MGTGRAVDSRTRIDKSSPLSGGRLACPDARRPKSAPDTRCILYARVCTKKQQEAENFDRPLGQLTAYAAERQWTVVAALTDFASGLNEKRRVEN